MKLLLGEGLIKTILATLLGSIVIVPVESDIHPAVIPEQLAVTTPVPTVTGAKTVVAEVLGLSLPAKTLEPVHATWLASLFKLPNPS